MMMMMMMEGSLKLLLSIYGVYCSCTMAMLFPVAAAVAASGNSHFVRNSSSSRHNNNSRRVLQNDLELFIPSFSQDEDMMAEVEMPTLTLLMDRVKKNVRQQQQQELGDVAYDTIQTTMNDYLEKLIVKDYFQQNTNYDFVKVRTEIINDRPYYSDDTDNTDETSIDIAGNAITMETILTFRDNDIGDEEQQTSQQTATSRESSSTDDHSSSNIPTPLELDLLAGLAWNDLTLFQNMLLVTATVEQTTAAFDTLTSITSEQEFPVSIPVVPEDVTEEITVAATTTTTTTTTNNNNSNTNKEQGSTAQQQQGDGSGNRGEDALVKPDRGDVVVGNNSNTANGNNNGFNVAAASEASSQFAEENNLQNDRLNPLWPALIVGLAVFLCTIIMLGYRRNKQSSSRKGHRSLSPDDEDDNDNDNNTDNIVHRVHDGGLSLDNGEGDAGGDEEFEIENGYHCGNTNSNSNSNTNNEIASDDQHNQEPKKKKKKWWSKLSASVTAPAEDNSKINTTILIEEDDRQVYDTADHIAYRGLGSDTDSDSHQDQSNDGIARRSCLRLPVIPKRERQASAHIIPDCNNSDDGSSNNSRSIDMTGNIVTNNNEGGAEAWRNPHGIVDEKEQVHSSDLDKIEKEKFVNYMKQGLTLEEASQRVLCERNLGTSITANTGTSSVVTKSTKTKQQGSLNWKRQQQVSQPRTVVPQGPSKLKTEVMNDGQTIVHYDGVIGGEGEGKVVDGSSGGGGGGSSSMLANPCSSNNLNVLKNVAGEDIISATTAAPQNPMVISDVTSNVSSSYTYNDSEFVRAVEELAAGEYEIA